MNLPLLDTPTPPTPPGDAAFMVTTRGFLDSIPDEATRYRVIMLTFRLLSHARMSSPDDGDLLRALVKLETTLATHVAMGHSNNAPRQPTVYGEPPA